MGIYNLERRQHVQCMMQAILSFSNYGYFELGDFSFVFCFVFILMWVQMNACNPFASLFSILLTVFCVFSVCVCVCVFLSMENKFGTTKIYTVCFDIFGISEANLVQYTYNFRNHSMPSKYLIKSPHKSQHIFVKIYNAQTNNTYASCLILIRSLTHAHHTTFRTSIFYCFAVSIIRLSSHVFVQQF